MKIPNKRIVNIEIAEQKRKQINEGVKIAQKVDALRQSLLSLEEQRIKFIEANKAEIERETKFLHKELQDTRDDIEVARKQYAELKKPLDIEWQNLKEQQFEFEQEQNLLLQKKTLLEDKEFESSLKEKELTENLYKQRILLEELEKNTEQTRENKELSETLLKESKNNILASEGKIINRLADIAIQEEKVQFDLQANENVRQRNEAKEEELKEKEREIQDKYETLQRTMERVNYGKPTSI